MFSLCLTVHLIASFVVFFCFTIGNSSFFKRYSPARTSYCSIFFSLAEFARLSYCFICLVFAVRLFLEVQCFLHRREEGPPFVCLFIKAFVMATTPLPAHFSSAAVQHRFCAPLFYQTPSHALADLPSFLSIYAHCYKFVHRKIM